MAGVDNRIVTMKFDNREFETNARTSLSTLQKLKESMNFGSIVGGTVRGLGAISSALSKIGFKTPFTPMIEGANKGLSIIGGLFDRLGMKNPFGGGVQGAADMQKAAQTAAGPSGMGALEGAVTGVSNKFIALTAVAVTALSNITNKAISSGTAFLNSFSFAPIKAGLEEYETNLKAIQTVQANTDRPLPEINSALEQLNAYSDQTIYNFGEMAKNVGTFTAAGVDLQTSVSAIKGIANMAALSGSNSQQAATAMYQLSQALASGKVGLMDWNSVVNAGMGGKKLQGALAQTAAAMGKLDEAQIRGTKSGEQLTIMGKSFRESIMAAPGQEAWLTSDILKNSLAALDGRFSKAALSAELLENGERKYKTAAEVSLAIEKARNDAAKEGVVYSDQQFKELQKLSTSAFEAATKVKTLGQVFEIAKETISSGWSASFKSIFGDLNQAKKLFTGMSEGLSGIIKDNALARNEMLAEWNREGGRTDVIEGLKNAWEGVWGIIQAVGKGFRDIFPKQTADSLLSMSERFRDFSKNLIPSKDTLAGITSIARGFFAIFGIGKTILSGVIEMFKTMFSAIGGGKGNFLDFGAGVGDMVTRFHEFLKSSGIVTAFFQGLGKILSVPLALLSGFAGMFTGMFGGFDTSAAKTVGDAVDGVGKRLSGLEVIGERIRSFFVKVGEFFGNLGKHIGNALMGIGDVVAGAFTVDTFGSTLDVINTTLLGGLVLLIKNFFNKGVSIDLTGGLFDGIKETLGEATGAFENMQTSLKADILLKLGAAIAVMAGALLVLSMIDPAALSKALVAMSAGFGILIGAMVVLMKYMGKSGLVQMYVVTSAMTKMAASILLLAFALKVLSNISFGDMIRGLIGLGAMMYILTKAMIPLAAGSKGMGKAAWSLIMVGIAINLLAVALKILGSMSWEEMARGLAGLAGTLLVLAVGLKKMPTLQAEAIGLIALGAAMNLLAIALKIFATMSWEEMAKGLVMLAGSLAIISIAIRSMPKTMMLQSVALVAVAGAMVVLAGALRIMGGMGWEAIAKGLILMAGAMAILAIGLNAIGIVGTIGAIGLVAAAGAMAIMAPILVTLGALAWKTILKGLVAIAGILTIFGVAGYLLAPVIPIILGIGAAMLLFGAGLALAGAGALAAATAFGIVVAAGSAGAQIMAGLLMSIIHAIPQALAAFGKGVVQFAVAIGQGAPRIAAAFGRVLSNLLDQVIKNVPKMGRAFLVMLNTALRVVVTAAPKIANAGLKLIVGFLEAINRHIPRIIDLAVSITVKFMDGVARNLDKIIRSGVNLILKFMEGITNAIRNNSEEFGRRGADIGIALVEGTVKGLSGAGDAIKDKLLALGKEAWQALKNFFGVDSPSKLMRDTIGRWLPIGMAEGIRAEADAPKGELETMGKTAMDTLKTTMARVNDAFEMSSDINPTITPVLDLSTLTREANKMNSILTAAPIMPTVSYATAADISSMTQAAEEYANSGGDDSDGGRGDQHITLEQHLHSPKPIDSVESYRAGKTLISLAKEALK